VAPKFVKRYATLGETIQAAVQGYVAEVRGGVFPSEEQSYHAPTLRIVTAEKESAQPGSVGRPV